MTTLTGRTEQLADVEFNNEVDEVQERMVKLRANPATLLAYEEVSASVRQAKLLLFNLSRDYSARITGDQRLLNLTQEAVRIAETSRASIPRKFLDDFMYVLSGLRRHARALREHRELYP
jgi:hypothetical protein